ncbi:MAG: hypothetical protein PHD00_08200 [Bacteroidales bacterium]|jgi:hypothetical protein|nr:hypothetical protein [Bacteroidales bacterium]MDD4673893.1 hypothetical protein [Bacteroidales bacterium]MDY0349381.1 hypothetical protein [Tenuifilaceae bacterium]
MDLQTRKLNAVEYLINIQDEDVFKKIEETIFKTKDVRAKALKPFTEKQLIERARKSNKDYLAGKYKAQEQLEIESQKW